MTNVDKLVEDQKERVQWTGLAQHVICKDGFKISIQWSRNHYCATRFGQPLNNPIDFELGYPSEVDDLIWDFAEDPTRPLETVYYPVDKEIVEALLEKHGDIDHYA